MKKRTGSFVTAILIITSMPVAAQWLNVPTKNIPRTKEGKPDLSAPAPRKPDGKPDLSGIWKSEPQNQKYGRGLPPAGLAADFKPGEFPIQPWAEALSKERIAGGRDWPPAHCLPPSIPNLDNSGTVEPLKIIQEPDLVVVLYEVFGLFRQVFLDGRTLARDANPTWLGYSVGHWDGDTLVVETAGFNGKAWLDVAGHPETDALHLTERFRRRYFGHLDLQITIDDPNAYTRPWSVRMPMQLVAGTELMEEVCNENEKDLQHRVGK